MDTNQLTPEDNKTIELIDERLRKLETLVYGFDTNPLGVDVVQPSPAKDDVRYVRCVKSVLVFTEGHIYKLSSVSANNIEPFVMYNGIQWGSYEQYRMFFMPASEEEYQAQQQVEDVKERFEVYVKPLYGCDGDYYIYIQTKKGDKLSEPEANEIAQKIKQLLTNI